MANKKDNTTAPNKFIKTAKQTNIALGNSHSKGPSNSRQPFKQQQKQNTDSSSDSTVAIVSGQRPFSSYAATGNSSTRKGNHPLIFSPKNEKSSEALRKDSSKISTVVQSTPQSLQSNKIGGRPSIEDSIARKMIKRGASQHTLQKQPINSNSTTTGRKSKFSEGVLN